MKTLPRELLLLGVLGGFGLLVFPALIYGVGVILLGRYAVDGTMGGFYSDLYMALGSLSPWPWLLVLGPWLGIQWLRILWLPFRYLLRRTDKNAPVPCPEPTPGGI